MKKKIIEKIKQHFVNVAEVSDLAYINTFSGKVKDVLRRAWIISVSVYMVIFSWYLITKIDNIQNFYAFLIILTDPNVFAVGAFMITILILLPYAYVFHKYIYMPISAVDNIIVPKDGGNPIIYDTPIWRIDGKIYLLAEKQTSKGYFSEDIIFCKDYITYNLSYGIRLSVLLEKLSGADLLKLEDYQEKITVHGDEVSVISIGSFFDKFRFEFDKMLLDIKEAAVKGKFNDAFSRYADAYKTYKYGVRKEKEEFCEFFSKEITLPEISQPWPIEASKIEVKTFANIWEEHDYTPVIQEIKADIFL